jgi:acyl-CoA thioester hydrolase
MVSQHGIDMVVAEASMRYRDSARFDDELDISATIERLGDTSITTAFTIERPADGALLTDAQLRHVFVDPMDSRKRAMPASVRAGLERFAA